MSILIELYDNTTPYNNFLTCKLLRPDKLVMLSSFREGDQEKARVHFENFKKVFTLHTEAIYQNCDTADLIETSESLKQIITEYGEENCVIDTIGGNETLLIAVGICIPEHPGIRVTGMRGDRPVWIWGKGTGESIRKKNYVLTVKDAIAIAAGEMKGTGHINRKDIDSSIQHLTSPMFGLYMKHRRLWPDFTFYLQKLCDEQYRVPDEPCTYTGPAEFMINAVTDKSVHANGGIFVALLELGILKNYSLDKDTCTLVFSDPRYVPLMRNTGSWVEIFAYVSMKRSGLFSDIEINPVLSWDNDVDDDDTLNEVDLIAIKGAVPIFISCKSAIPTNEAINEILAITRRFGNAHAKAILITASKTKRDAPAVNRRAEDSGVYIIDQKKLSAADIKKIFLKMFPEQKKQAE